MPRDRRVTRPLRRAVREYEATIDGQRVTVHVFPPRAPAELEGNPVETARDDSDMPAQRYIRRERERSEA